VEHAKFANTDDSAVKGSSVLLKTAAADVTNGYHMEHITILFDEGATRSFIRKELADHLQLKTNRTEDIKDV
jgi:hypothetical protein